MFNCSDVPLCVVMLSDVKLHVVITVTLGRLKAPGGVPIELCNFFRSSVARDQSPGHERMFDSPIPES